MPTRTISLARAAQSTGSAYGQMGYRMTVTATGTNVSSAIFRYMRRPIDPSQPAGTTEDVFQGVCWPEELVSLPLNSPASDNDPWFRLATLDLILVSEAQAQEFWTRLRSDITELLTALSKMDTLSVSETVTITV